MLACEEGGRWTVMLCWTAPPTCLHLIPTPYPLLAISTNVLLSLLFFTVFGTANDHRSQWPATRRLQKFHVIKSQTKKKNESVTIICDVFFVVQCRRRHCQTWKVAANTWNTFGMLTQRSVGYGVLLQSLFCSVPCTGFEFSVERFSPQAFGHDISTQLSIYTFTARLLLWQVVIKEWFVVHYVRDCMRATDVYCNWHTAGLAATLCLHFENIRRLF